MDDLEEKYPKWQAERIRLGVCGRCGVAGKPLQNKTRCAECQAKQSASKQAMKLKRKSLGLCPHCGTRAEPSSVTCERCASSASKRLARRIQRRAIEGKCTRCGQKDPLDSLKEASMCHRLCETCYLKGRAKDRLGSRSRWIAIRNKLQEQSFRCAYTGELLILGVNDSLDHILPVSRYPELQNDVTNVEWVRRDINTMKRDRTAEEFWDLIELIARCRRLPLGRRSG